MNALVQEYLDEIADLPDFGGSLVGLNTRGLFKNTPLHIAAIRGDLAIIRALIDEGAEIDVHGEHGYTPLHESVEQGHVDAVRLLLARGASKQCVNDNGQKPLELAKLLNHREIQGLLAV